MTKTCHECGAENPPTANFCRQCGRPWADAPLRPATRTSTLMRQWRALRHRMTRKEVRKVLGEPARIETADPANPAARETWSYTYADAQTGAAPLSGVLHFNIADLTLASWVEPEWSNVD